MQITFDEQQQLFHLKNEQISYIIGIEKEKEYYDLIVNRIAENEVRLENSEEVTTL